MKMRASKWMVGWAGLLMACSSSSQSSDMSTASLADCSGVPAGGICFSISGESLALNGYNYPPLLPTDTAFTDGWQVRFDKLLVTVDKIQIHTDPDLNAGDQSQEGSLVAELDGPWAVDLHKGGPLTGKGGVGANDGVEEALGFESLLNQNMNGNAPFDPTQTYAFGFSTVPATPSAKFVNIESTDPDYATMIQNGCTIYYLGTATWIGNSPNANADAGASSSCTSTIPTYNFSDVPTTVNFQLCYRSPTSYINCQNPDQQGPGIGGEDSPRGIIVNTNFAYIAQLTLHTDHPLWESVLENSPLHFDQFAANSSQSGGTAVASLGTVCGSNSDCATGQTCDMTRGFTYSGSTATTRGLCTGSGVVGKDWQAMTDSSGNPLPWRACLAGYTPPAGMQMSFNSKGIPYTPNGPPTMGLRDYYDYTTYVQSTQGHLNSNGLCYVSRNYPAP